MSELNKYITHSNDKWTVHAESGKPMGTYDSEAAAKKRLAQIEYFKQTKKNIDALREQLFKLGIMPEMRDERASIAQKRPLTTTKSIDQLRELGAQLTKQEVTGLALTREDLGVRHKPKPSKKLSSDADERLAR